MNGQYKICFGSSDNQPYSIAKRVALQEGHMRCCCSYSTTLHEPEEIGHS